MATGVGAGCTDLRLAATAPSISANMASKVYRQTNKQTNKPPAMANGPGGPGGTHGRTARKVSIDAVSPVVTFPSEEGPPRPVAAGARPCYHLLPHRPKRERGARPAAPLRRPRRRGIRRQILGKVHRRLPVAPCAMPSPWAPPVARLSTSTSHAESGYGGWCVQRGRTERASCTAHNSCFT